MGLAIAGMHYTAMAAVSFFPTLVSLPTRVTMGTLWLSTGVTAVAVTIALLAIIATNVGKAFRATNYRVRVDNERIIDAIESLTDGFTLFDDKGRLTMCNNVLQKMYPELANVLKPGTRYEDLLAAKANMRKELPEGVSAEAYIAENVRNFREGRHSGVPREERLEDGRWIYSREHSIKHGGLVSVLTDVTPIKELQAVYEKRASEDTLTGLVNRRVFEDRLEHAFALAKRLDKPMALLYIDLDRFKPINDDFGHDTGDAVLKEVAARLRRAARDSDTVARLGGDEFALLMASNDDRAGAEALASRIIVAICQPIFVGGRACHVRVSIGIAVLPPPAAGKEALMKAADEAMYEAKKAGGSQYHMSGDLLVSI